MLLYELASIYFQMFQTEQSGSLVTKWLSGGAVVALSVGDWAGKLLIEALGAVKIWTVLWQRGEVQGRHQSANKVFTFSQLVLFIFSVIEGASPQDNWPHLEPGLQYISPWCQPQDSVQEAQCLRLSCAYCH